MYVLEISFLHSYLNLELWVKSTCKLNLLLQNFYLPQPRTKYNVAQNILKREPLFAEFVLENDKKTLN